MNESRRDPDQIDPASLQRRDAGATLVEILVAVVLLGTVVVATLGALQASVVGTRTERDHARAHQWLQSATGVLQATDRVSCQDAGGDPGELVMRQAYQAVLQNEVESPTGWQEWQITIIPPIRVWDGTRYWDPYDAATPATCFEPQYQLQLITIRVVSPDGRIIETRQVVKGA